MYVQIQIDLPFHGQPASSKDSEHKLSSSQTKGNDRVSDTLSLAIEACMATDAAASVQLGPSSSYYCHFTTVYISMSLSKDVLETERVMIAVTCESECA